MSAFLPVPEYVLTRSDVTWGAKVLLGLLYRHERARKRQGWPSVGQLVEGMRQPRRSVERWLAELVDAGLVTSERAGREVRYAPFLAVDGSTRDLWKPATDGGGPESEHPPHVADVPVGHPPHVADVEPERPPHVADVAPSAPLSVVRERSEEERSSLRSERARDVEPEDVGAPDLPERVRSMRGALVTGYRRRWEAAASDFWPGPRQHAAAFDDLARHFARYADGTERIERALDGFFGSDDPFIRKARWAPSLLARDPGRYLEPQTRGPRPPSPPSAFRDMDDAEIDRRLGIAHG